MNKDQLKREYRKARRRVTQIIRRNKQKGYIYTEDVLPKIPKVITEASIRKLNKLSTRDLEEKAKYFMSSEEMGELLDPIEDRGKIKKDLAGQRRVAKGLPYEKLKKQKVEKQPKPKSSKQDKEWTTQITDQDIIDSLFRTFLTYPEPLARKFINAVNKLRQEHDDHKVAIAIEKAMPDIQSILKKHRYASDSAAEELVAELMTYIPMDDDTYKEMAEEYENQQEQIAATIEPSEKDIEYYDALDLINFVL